MRTLVARVTQLGRRQWGAILLVGFVALFATSMARVARKVRRNQTAYLRWKPEVQELLRGGAVYQAGNEGPEGHPNLPILAIALAPFYRLSDLAGALLFTAVKCACAVVIVLAPVRALRAHGPPVARAGPVASATAGGGDAAAGASAEAGAAVGARWPDWGAALLLALSARVIVSDLTHGNVNLLVGGLVALALVCLVERRDALAGGLLGVAAVAKLTPALFLPYLAWKRRWRACGGALAGIVVALVLVPSAVLGGQRNLDLVRGWTDQMIAPLVAQQRDSATPVGHMNQSLYGVGHRLLTDVVAVPADPKRGHGDVRVNALSLEGRQATAIVGVAALAVLGLLAWACWPGRRAALDNAGSRAASPPAGLRDLGEVAAVFLAMVLLSPRSWKHHYILLALPHAFLFFACLRRSAAGQRVHLPGVLAVVGLVAHLLSSESTLGARGSDFAEAYGVFVWGGAALFLASVLELVALRREGFAGAGPAPP